MVVLRLTAFSKREYVQNVCALFLPDQSCPYYLGGSVRDKRFHAPRIPNVNIQSGNAWRFPPPFALPFFAPIPLALPHWYCSVAILLQFIKLCRSCPAGFSNLSLQPS